MQYQRAKVINSEHKSLNGRLVWVRAQPPVVMGDFYEVYGSVLKIKPFPAFITNIHKDDDWAAILQIAPPALELLAEFSADVPAIGINQWLKETNPNAQA